LLPKDYSDMLSALNDAGVEYLIVGAYALAAHGNVRATGDIDIWVRPTPENAQRVWQALGAFRAPRRDLKPEDFCDPDVVYQIGIPPTRIDILTSIDGVTFDDAWPHRTETTLNGVKLNVLGPKELLFNKRAAGRPKDLADAAWLEEQDRKQRP
jgi:hypothetical protein